MKVLLWMPTASVIPGGHRVQLEQTSKHLNAIGVCAHITVEPDPDLSPYDVVHGFTLSTHDLRRCRTYGIPVVLSPIYWNRAYVMGLNRRVTNWRTWKTRSRHGVVLLRSALMGQHIEKCEAYVHWLQTQRILFELADLLLPNSEMEAQTLYAELQVTTPYCVVPNAVDHRRFELPNAQTPQQRDHVLYAGRIEPHKNQLGLIQAMRGSNIPVVIVGPPHPHHPDYYTQCKRMATGNISLLPGVEHDQLPLLYQAARAHVLPSKFETTGLVSLEAALCGCNIVTTQQGYAREYFQDMAWYCDPADPRSIRRAIESAFHAPPRPELRQHILARYTWEHTAQATLAAYEQALRSRRRDRAAIVA